MYGTFIECMVRYALPFDRHDWVVERGGRNVRYVIDFYAGQQIREPGKPLAPIAMHLDVRPALDSVQACFERLDFTFRSMFKPLTMPKIWNRFMQSKEAK